MNTNLELLLVAVAVITLAEVTYLLARLPKTSVKAKDRAILVDTSVVMDGRIVAVAKTGFIGGTLVIPRSVIGELQFLADNADPDKRARARFGLDVVKELQDMDGISVEILQDGSRTEHGVDERLLELAKQHNAVVCTIDYNLNKVAVVEGIQVLNINELAQSLRMAHLPGDRMRLEVVQKGNDAHQGVAYLADGTMVVVEQAASLIGQTVEIEIIRSLQTAAGKMMFARRVSVPQAAAKQPEPRQNGQNAPRTRKVAESRESRPAKQASQTQAPRRQDDRQKQPQPQPQPQAKVTQQASQPSNGNSGRPRAPFTPPRSRQKRVDHEANLVDMIDHQQ